MTVRIKKIGLAGLILFAKLVLSAIQTPYDYVGFRLTSKDGNGKKVEVLRQEMVDFGYLPFNFDGIPELFAIKYLKKGDVLIFGDIHAAYVNDKGNIDHFIGKWIGEKPVRIKSSRIHLQDTFFKDWSLENIVNFQQTHDPISGKRLDGSIFPFKNAPIQLWRKVDRLVIQPQQQKILVGETVSFYIEAHFADGSVLPVKTFDVTGKEAGNFPVSSDYFSREAEKAIIIVRDEKGVKTDSPCGKNEAWNRNKGRCECLPGYIHSFTDHKCKSIDEIIAEIAANQKGDPCEKKMVEQRQTLFVQENKIKQGFDHFDLIENKFFHRIYSQTADPCLDGVLAYCFWVGGREKQKLQVLMDQVSDLYDEMIVNMGVCRQVNRGELSDFLADVWRIKGRFQQIESRYQAMKNRVAESACDEDEVLRLGETMISQMDIDPSFWQDGGAMSEIPADGYDQDGDALMDEDVAELAGVNTVIIVYISRMSGSGSFLVEVRPYGNLGIIQKLGRRSFGLNLAPGSYTATVNLVGGESPNANVVLSIFLNGRLISRNAGIVGRSNQILLPFSIKN